MVDSWCWKGEGGSRVLASPWCVFLAIKPLNFVNSFNDLYLVTCRTVRDRLSLLLRHSSSFPTFQQTTRITETDSIKVRHRSATGKEEGHKVFKKLNQLTFSASFPSFLPISNRPGGGKPQTALRPSDLVSFIRRKHNLSANIHSSSTGRNHATPVLYSLRTNRDQSVRYCYPAALIFLTRPANSSSATMGMEAPEEEDGEDMELDPAELADLLGTDEAAEEDEPDDALGGKDGEDQMGE